METIGKDISSLQYWEERAADYNSHIEGPYHRHRMAMVMALLEGVSFDGRQCVDFGCGDGIMCEFLKSQGAQIVASDISPAMIAAARQRFEGRLAPEVFKVGGVECLEELPASSVDVILALNVAAYFSNEEDERFYTACRAALRGGGGTLIITHSNELFDLFTLNRFTARFFTRHFVDEGHKEAIESLLKHPAEPQQRSSIFNIRENPLSYATKLRAFGLKVERQEYANFHDLPPLLMDPTQFKDIDLKKQIDTLAFPEEDRWKLMFQCSIFGARAQRE